MVLVVNGIPVMEPIRFSCLELGMRMNLLKSNLLIPSP